MQNIYNSLSNYYCSLQRVQTITMVASLHIAELDKLTVKMSHVKGQWQQQLFLRDMLKVFNNLQF